MTYKTDYLYKLENVPKNLYIDLDCMKIFLDNQWYNFHIERTPYECLCVLALNCGQVLSYQTIIDNHDQWRLADFVGNEPDVVAKAISKANVSFRNAIVNAIGESKAKQLFDVDSLQNIKCIKTLKKIGYVFSAKRVSRESIPRDNEISFNAANSPYATIFTVLDCVLSLSLPDYSTQRSANTKYVPLTRATLISLAKYCANIDIDNELSIDCSIECLNQKTKNSSNAFWQEFTNRGYSFSGTDESVFVVNNVESEVVDFAEDPDALFETLKTLYEAYRLYDIHNEVSSVKKKELNITLSVFINAISLFGVFSTSERKKYLCNVIEHLICTHNHDANFLYPILYNPKEKAPPVVEVGISKMVELIGNYCEDVYETDNNVITFINNFIETIDYYHMSSAEKVAILDGLIYQNKLYNLRIWQELANIDKRKIAELQLYVESEIFSLVNQGVADDSSRKIIAFTCMFARGVFDSIIYFQDPKYLRSSSEFLKFVLRRFESIVKFNSIRKLDVAQGISKALLTISKYDSSAAQSIIKGIDINSPCFDDCVLLKDTYNFLINGTFSSYISAEYRKLFSNSHDFFDYVKKNIISISSNPFLTCNNPLVLIALINIRKAYEEEDVEITTELIIFADNVLFWLLEASARDKDDGNTVGHLRLLSDINYCLDINKTPVFKNQKKKLFAGLISENRYNQIGVRLLSRVWQSFLYDIKRGVFVDELNECIGYCFNNYDINASIEFLLTYFRYANHDNKKRISEAIKKFIDNKKHLSLNYAMIQNMAFVLKDSTEYTNKLLWSVPHFREQTIYEKHRVLGKLLTNDVVDQIICSLVNGEDVYHDFVTYFIKADIRSWERAYLKKLLSKLLFVNNFMSLDPALQNSLVHYTKSKGEYRHNIRMLLDNIASMGCFFELDTKVKAALTLHLHSFIDANKHKCYSDYLNTVLNELTDNAYTHADIKQTYGIRTDTLIYHILDNYKGAPEKTARICISTICKTYKQLNRVCVSDKFDLYESKLLMDRIRLFTVAVSNPCIRNIAKHYVDKMYYLMNEYDGRKNFKLDQLYNLLISIKRNLWPKWFGIEYDKVTVIVQDFVYENVELRPEQFLINVDPDVPNYPNTKAKDALRLWRCGKDDLLKSIENEVVVWREGDMYIPISGWSMVYEYVTDNDFKPEHINSIVVQFAEICPLQFAKSSEKELTLEKIISLFQQLLEDYLRVLPPRAIKQKKYRIYIDECAEEVIGANHKKIRAFVDFYYDYVFNTTDTNIRIKTSALEAYYDYYCDLRKTLDAIIPTLSPTTIG